MMSLDTAYQAFISGPCWAPSMGLAPCCRCSYTTLILHLVCVFVGTCPIDRLLCTHIYKHVITQVGGRPCHLRCWLKSLCS